MGGKRSFALFAPRIEEGGEVDIIRVGVISGRQFRFGAENMDITRGDESDLRALGPNHIDGVIGGRSPDFHRHESPSGTAGIALGQFPRDPLNDGREMAVRGLEPSPAQLDFPIRIFGMLFQFAPLLQPPYFRWNPMGFQVGNGVKLFFLCFPGEAPYGFKDHPLRTWRTVFFKASAALESGAFLRQARDRVRAALGWDIPA